MELAGLPPGAVRRRPPHAAAAARQEHRDLRVVASDLAQWVAVELTQPLPVTEGGRLLVDVTIERGGEGEGEGDGGLLALALRGEVPAADGRRPTLTVKQFTGGNQTRSTHDTLPAGRYRLYLVAGEKAAARLVTALPGAVGLRTTTPVPLIAATAAGRIDLVSATNPAGSIAFAYFSDERPLEGVFRLEYAAKERSEVCSTKVYVHDWQRYARGCPGGSPRFLLGSSEEIAFHVDGEPIGYGVNSGPNAFAPPYVKATGQAFAFDDPPLQVAGSVPAPAPQAAQPAPSTAVWASLPSGRAAVRRGTAHIAVLCGAATSCRGRLLVARRARAFRIAPGRVDHLRIPVPRRARRVAVTLIGRGADGGPVAVERTIRLVRKR